MEHLYTTKDTVIYPTILKGKLKTFGFLSPITPVQKHGHLITLCFEMTGTACAGFCCCYYYWF